MNFVASAGLLEGIPRIAALPAIGSALLCGRALYPIRLFLLLKRLHKAPSSRFPLRITFPFPIKVGLAQIGVELNKAKMNLQATAYVALSMLGKARPAR